MLIIMGQLYIDMNDIDAIIEGGNMLFTFLVGGRAGQGVKKAGGVVAELMAESEYSVFQMDDYQSLIKGGHNFSVVSCSEDKIYSHYMSCDLIVALDDRSLKMHLPHLADNGVLIYNSDESSNEKGIGIPMTDLAKKYPMDELRIGLTAVVSFCRVTGLSLDDIKKIIERKYGKDIENNFEFASDIYNALGELDVRLKIQPEKGIVPVLSGNECIALGAALSGLDTYFGYPMTPASSIMHFYAQQGKELGVTMVHAESEIGVINMAIGAAFTGARTMVGTSGGGFALMEEAFSLAGMAEVPLLTILSQRPGPSTGVPTYTEQADLLFSLHPGQGEFPRIVASPAGFEDAFLLSGTLLELSWRFQTPAILLTEKHLSESRASVNLEEPIWLEVKNMDNDHYKRYVDTESGISGMAFPPSPSMIKWNSYESDEAGITTEKPEMIAQKHMKRHRKTESLKTYLKDIETVKTYGDGNLVIFTWGSTTLSVLEAIKGLEDVMVVQPVFLEPFPVWEFERYKDKKSIVIEQSVGGQFEILLKDKTGIKPKDRVRRFDGRAFDPQELHKSIKEIGGSL